MVAQTWLMLAILVVMFAFLVWERFPPWLVFMGTLTACMTLKLAPADALLRGFGNSGVVTVASLFPVAAGMYATGAISLLSQRLIGQPHSLWAAQIKILPAVATGSAFLNNTPLVAMMIPVVRDLGRTTGLARSKLLMGLSFASILGGYYPSDADPFSKLPILRFLGASYVHGDMSLAMKEIKLLENLVKK
jgi:Na+/H+ antiporter NhaD/arsenite permease-like protein